MANPSLYDAMFLMNTALTFGLEAPLPLRAAFGELEAMVGPFVDAPDLGARTEVAWTARFGHVGPGWTAAAGTARSTPDLAGGGTARRRGRGAGLASVSACPSPVAWGYG
ncbi:hypothetical protein [Nocardia sp. NPDC047038]|uniref:hypothetical protein n=1 Tax=Nocardia sp. NPDC047038 TaxID=3154338 RepID=UPI0033F228B9